MSFISPVLRGDGQTMISGIYKAPCRMPMELDMTYVGIGKNKTVGDLQGTLPNADGIGYDTCRNW